MTDIAHCSRCGSLPEHGHGNQVKTLFYAPYCSRCGMCTPEDEQEWSSQEKAELAWTRAVLSDLAAQERELCAVPVQQNWGTLDQMHMVLYPMDPAEARGCVMRRYAYLGQNPLSLPT